jgi:hypothetical protein
MAQLGDSPIFLIGYRGTGKTSAARELAGRLGFHWVDADDLVEEMTGKAIAAIFAVEGEAGFRQWEARVVSALSRKRRTVVKSKTCWQSAPRFTGNVLRLSLIRKIRLPPRWRRRSRPICNRSQPVARMYG